MHKKFIALAALAILPVIAILPALAQTADTTAPTVVSAQILRDANMFSVTYSEPVTGSADDYVVSIAGVSRNVQLVIGETASRNHIILFAGLPAPPGYGGTVSISNDVMDVAGNRLESVRDQVITPYPHPEGSEDFLLFYRVSQARISCEAETERPRAS